MSRSIKEITKDLERARLNGDPTWITFWEGEVRLAKIRDIPDDRLSEICAAENDGRLVVLPCKVGTPVYFPVDKGTRFADVMRKPFEIKDIERIGETVFLTRKEAEAKLKEAQP